MAMTFSRLAVMASRRRAPCVAMLTWSSWLAEVGMLSMLAGWHSMRFSATSAAAVTCAIMKPELTPLSEREECRQAAHLRIDQQRDAPLGDRADLGAGERQDVSREGHRLGVEVAAREHFVAVGEDQRVVGDRVGFGQQGAPPVCVIRSRQAPITCGWQRSEYGSCTRSQVRCDSRISLPASSSR